MQIKRWLKIFRVGRSKMGVASLVTGVYSWLYLKIEQME